MNKKRLIQIVICTLLIGSMLTGCGKKEPAPEIIKEETDDITTSSTETEEPESISDANDRLRKDDVTQTLDLSDNWVDLEFALDGKKFKMNETFSNFTDIGYYSEPYLLDGNLDPGETTVTCCIRSDRFKEYDDSRDYYVVMKFVNEGEETVYYQDCSIFYININIDNFTSSYPDVKLPKGITWGSTEEEVIAAYGDPYLNMPYDDDIKICSYLEENEEGKEKKLSLQISETKGLVGFYFENEN